MNKKFGTRLLFIVMASMVFVPSVSANSDEEVTPASTDVNSLEVKPFSLEAIEPLATYQYSIIQGQSRIHYTNVNNSRHLFIMDLKWDPVDNSLILIVTTPTGITYSPLTDASDGSINGRIHQTIYEPGGLPTGLWRSRVYGESVSGTATYDYNVTV